MLIDTCLQRHDIANDYPSYLFRKRSSEPILPLLNTRLTGPNPTLKPSTNAMIASELGMAHPRFMKTAKRKAPNDIVAAETISSCLGMYFYDRPCSDR
jgi:hypothetical protein